MLKRLTFEEMVGAFGDPRPHMLASGVVGASWEASILAFGNLPAPLPLSFLPGVSVRRFRSHRRLVHRFEAAFRDIFNDPEVWQSWADGGFGGVYEFRANRRNPRVLSAHAFGAAVDGDVADNYQGKAPRVHPRLEEIMERHGFLWGGRFKGAAVDGMHFEFADLGGLVQ